MEIKARPSTVLTFGCGIMLGFAALVLLVSGRDMSPSKSVASSEHSAIAPLANTETAWKVNSLSSQKPSTVNIYVMGRETLRDTSEARSVALSPSTAVESGWRSPSATTTDTEQSSSTTDAYQQEFRTQPPTNDQPTHRECMLAADDVVANGWHNSPVETGCFAGPEDPAIGDAYGELESESGKGSATNPYPGYATCATEDAQGPCMWSASEQGNGIGHSFLRDADGTVTYLN